MLKGISAILLLFVGIVASAANEATLSLTCESPRGTVSIGSKGELIGSYSGAITSIIVGGVSGSNINTPLTESGYLYLDNGTDEPEIVNYSSYTGATSPFTFTVNATLKASYSAADTCYVMLAASDSISQKVGTDTTYYFHGIPASTSCFIKFEENPDNSDLIIHPRSVDPNNGIGIYDFKLNNNYGDSQTCGVKALFGPVKASATVETVDGGVAGVKNTGTVNAEIAQGTVTSIKIDMSNGTAPSGSNGHILLNNTDMISFSSYSGEANPYTFTVSGTATKVYAAGTSVSVICTGEVSVKTKTGLVNNYENILAVANSGYKFIRWEKTAGDAANTTITTPESAATTLSVTSDAEATSQAVAIKAIFAEVATHTLTYEAVVLKTDTGGKVDADTAAGSGTVAIKDLTASNFTDLPSVGFLALSNGSASENIDYTGYSEAGGVYTFTLKGNLQYAYTVDDSCTVSIVPGYSDFLWGCVVNSYAWSGSDKIKIAGITHDVSTTGYLNLISEQVAYTGYVKTDDVYTFSLKTNLAYMHSPGDKVSGISRLYGTCATTVYDNTNYGFQAVADTGYRFNEWTVSGNASIVSSNAIKTEVALSGGDGTLKAPFKKVEHSTLTLTAEPGDTILGATDIAGIVGGNKFQIAGDKTTELANQTYFVVTGTTNGVNDKVYQVVGLTYVDPNTEIQVAAIPDATVTDGKLYFNKYGTPNYDNAVSVNIENGVWSTNNIDVYEETGYRFEKWETSGGDAVFGDAYSKSTQVYMTENSTVKAVMAATATAKLTLAVSPSGSSTGIGNITAVTAGAGTGMFTVDSFVDAIEGTMLTVSDATETKNNGNYIVKSIAYGVTNLAPDFSINTSSNSFILAGDLTDGVAAGDYIQVKQDFSDTKGYYKVTNVTLSSDNTKTVITVLPTNSMADVYTGEAINKVDSSTITVFQEVAADAAAAKGTLAINSTGSVNYTKGAGKEVPFNVNVNANSAINIEAIPTQAYAFVEWKVSSGSAIIENSTDPSTAVFLVGDATISATFIDKVTMTFDITDHDSNKRSYSIQVAKNQAIPIKLSNNNVYYYENGSRKNTGLVIPRTNEFSAWTGGDNVSIAVANATETTAVLSNDATVTVNWQKAPAPSDNELAQLTIATNPVNGGSVGNKVPGIHSLIKNKWYSIEAVPAVNHHFVRWEVSDGAKVIVNSYTDKQTQVYITDAGTLMAKFQKDEVDTKTAVILNASPASSGGNNTVTIKIDNVDNGLGTYCLQKNVWYSIAINNNNIKTGWKFVKWTATNADIQEAYSVSTQISPTGANATVTAEFAVVNTSSTESVLTVTEGNGYIYVNEKRAAQHTLKNNLYYQIEALPKDGYYFIGWTAIGGASIVEENARMTYVKLTENGSLTADFAKKSDARLTLVSNPADVTVLRVEGASSVTNTFTVSTGLWVDISASYNSNGYLFTGWQVTAGSASIADVNDANTRVFLKEGSTITATFIKSFNVPKEPVNVTIKATPENGGSPAINSRKGLGTWVLNSMTEHYLNANVQPGFDFLGWTVEPASNVYIQNASDEWQTVVFTGDVTISANYQQHSNAALTLNVEPAGTGSTSPTAETTESKAINKWYTVTATANDYYKFVKWKLTSGSATIRNPYNPSTEIFVTDDTILTATFEAVEMATLTMNIEPAGSAYNLSYSKDNGYNWVYTKSLPEGVSVNKSEWIGIDVEDNLPGYKFTKWEIAGDAILKDEPFKGNNEICLTGDATVTAKFEIVETVKLTIKVNPAQLNGNPIASAQYVNKNQWIELTGPDYTGYNFTNWTKDSGEASILNTYNRSTKIYISEDTVVTAGYQFDPSATLANVTLKADPAVAVSEMNFDGEARKINQVISANTRSSGKSYSLTVNPLAGYKFKYWEIDGAATVNDITDSSTVIHLTGNATITAKFATTPEVTVTIASNPANAWHSAAYEPGTYIFNKNQWHYIYARSTAGYKFTGWTIPENAGVLGYAAKADDVNNVFFTDNATLTMNFEAVPTGTLTIIDGKAAGMVFNGNSNYAGSHMVNQNEFISISAVPAEGYAFTGWKIEGEAMLSSLNTDTQNSVKLIGSSGTLTAQFAAVETASLTKKVLPQDIDSLTTVQNVAKNTWLDLIATDYSGYTFSNWTVEGDATLLDDTYDKTNKIFLTGDATVTANYTATANSTAYLTIAASPAAGIQFYGDDTTYKIDSDSVLVGDIKKINLNTLYTIRVRSADGYSFSGWSITENGYITDISEEGWSRISLRGDATLTANFVPITTVPLTLADSPANAAVVKCSWPGNSNKTGTVNAPAKEWLDIDADAYPGYKFSSWQVTTGSATIQDVNSKSTKAYLTEAATITANFTAIETTSLTMVVSPVGNAGKTSPAGTVTVNKNDWVHISAQPALGYTFSSWSISENTTLKKNADINSNYIMLSGEATVTATFTAIETAILTQKQSHKDGEAKSVVQKNKWIKIKAPADVFSQFTGWSIEGNAIINNANASSTYVYLTGDAIVTANYLLNPDGAVSLTVKGDPEPGAKYFGIAGYYSHMPSGSVVSVHKHEWVYLYVDDFNVSSEGIGYSFSHWKVEGSATVADTYKNTTYVYLTEDSTVTAVFTQCATTKLTVVVTPAVGDVSPYEAGTHIVQTNKWLTIAAKPFSGYKFTSWSLDQNGVIENAIRKTSKLFLTGEATLTVNYEATSVATLTVGGSSGGVIGIPELLSGPAEGPHIVNQKERIKLTAIPTVGYKFTGWSISENGKLYKDESDIAAENVIYAVLSGDATVTPSFEHVGTVNVAITSNPIGAAVLDNLKPIGASGFKTYTLSKGVMYDAGVYADTIGYASQAQFSFAKWETDGGVTVSGERKDRNGNNVASFSAESDGTLKATFVEVAKAKITFKPNPAYAATNRTFAYAKTEEFSKLSWSYMDQNCSANVIENNVTYLLRMKAADAYKFSGFNTESNIEFEEAKEIKDCWLYENSTKVSKNDYVWYYMSVNGDAEVTVDFTERDIVKVTVETYNSDTDAVDAGVGIIATYDTNYPDNYFDIDTSIDLYEGILYKFKAYSNTGYYLSHWDVIKGDGAIVYSFLNSEYININKMTFHSDTTLRAVFTATKPAYPILKVSGDTNEVISMTPEIGDYNVIAGKTYEISVSPRAGKAFICWEIINAADNISIANAASETTQITLSGDAEIQPVFGTLLTGAAYIDVSNLIIKTSNANTEDKANDSVKVKSRLYTDELPSLADGLRIGIDGVLYEIDTWTTQPEPESEKKQVYEYTDKEQGIKLTIDTIKDVMNISLLKQDIFDKISPADGIDVYLIIGTVIVKETVKANEKTKWNYKIIDKEAKKDEENVKVTKFTAKYDTIGGVAQNSGGYNILCRNLGDAPEGFDESTIVYVLLTNNEQWKLDPADENTTLKVSKGEKYTYRYKPTNKKYPETYQLTLDFGKKKSWSFKAIKSSKGKSLARVQDINVTLKYADLSVWGAQLLVIEDSSTNIKTQVIIKSTFSYHKKSLQPK